LILGRARTSTQPRPLTIGLTGGIAAGKSEALAAFERLGAATMSSDAVVHELLGDQEVRERLIERWGPEIAPGGRVDRERVSRVVFERPGDLAWLESLLHPLVGDRIAAWISSLPARPEIAVVEVPLLFEAAMEAAFDATVAVVAPEEARRERAAARGQGLVSERAARQLRQEEKAARADHVIHNDGSLQQLEARLADLVAQLRRGAAEHDRDPLQT
jgi:dephospho-CoA kinase